MSSDALATTTSHAERQTGPQAGQTPRNRRQEETFRKVLAAGMETLREKSYADLTVRAVAARAKVAPATAYTYFSSKNHLIAEVYLDLVRQVPYFTDVNDPMPTRVRPGAAPPGAGGRRRARGRRGVHDGVAERRRRPCGDRGARPHRRGDPPPHHFGHRARRDPGTVSALEMAFFGALVQAGSGEFTYHKIADRLADAVGLILTGTGADAAADTEKADGA